MRLHLNDFTRAVAACRRCRELQREMGDRRSEAWACVLAKASLEVSNKTSCETGPRRFVDINNGYSGNNRTRPKEVPSGSSGIQLAQTLLSAASEEEKQEMDRRAKVKEEKAGNGCRFRKRWFGSCSQMGKLLGHGKSAGQFGACNLWPMGAAVQPQLEARSEGRQVEDPKPREADWFQGAEEVGAQF